MRLQVRSDPYLPRRSIYFKDHRFDFNVSVPLLCRGGMCTYKKNNIRRFKDKGHRQYSIFKKSTTTTKKKKKKITTHERFTLIVLYCILFVLPLKDIWPSCVSAWKVLLHDLWTQGSIYLELIVIEDPPLLVFVSPDVILCGWLGSKHQLTN